MSFTLNRRVRRHLRARRQADLIASSVIWGLTVLTFGVILALLVYLIALGASSLSWHFLTGLSSDRSAGGGIGPQIYNSFYVLFLTLIFTVPIAVAAALYIFEYARPGRFPQTVRFAADVLASVPSIVIGLFGLLVFVYVLRWRFSALGGALTLTILNLPSMLRVAGEALRSVPQATREASLALGATRWQTISHVVVPGAFSAFVSGIVLVAGRIFGETAALIYTAGVGIETGAAYDLNPFHPAETLSVHLWYTHSESLVPDVTRIGNGSALVLICMILLFNVAARLVGRWLAGASRGRTIA